MARGETVFEGLCASSSLANERAAFELAWSPDAYIRSFPVAISYYQYYNQPWLVPSKRLANPLVAKLHASSLPRRRLANLPPQLEA